MKFEHIPQFTRCAGYAVDIPWSHLLTSLKTYIEDYKLDIDPDFQRAHVWDDTKRTRYVEYALRGGMSGGDIYTNCPEWNNGGRDDFVLVDGKQRLEAVCKFLRNEIPAFGALYNEYEDELILTGPRFRWHVNDLATRIEVLQWYLDLNTGGVIHTEDELDRVRGLLVAEKANPNPKDVARAKKRIKEAAERKTRYAAQKERRRG